MLYLVRHCAATGQAHDAPLTADGLRQAEVVTHGNLLTLLLRHFDGRSGFETWPALKNPDVFRR
jgi:broad specificity phosphatase PhoE